MSQWKDINEKKFSFYNRTEWNNQWWFKNRAILRWIVMTRVKTQCVNATSDFSLRTGLTGWLMWMKHWWLSIPLSTYNSLKNLAVILFLKQRRIWELQRMTSFEQCQREHSHSSTGVRVINNTWHCSPQQVSTCTIVSNSSLRLLIARTANASATGVM